MGKGQSKICGPPEGPCVEIMLRKYGEESVMCLHEWSELGFPVGDSFSSNQLQKLEEKLKGKEDEIKKKKKIKRTDLEKVEKHKNCLRLGKKEVE